MSARLSAAGRKYPLSSITIPGECETWLRGFGPVKSGPPIMDPFILKQVSDWREEIALLQAENYAYALAGRHTEAQRAACERRRQRLLYIQEELLKLSWPPRDTP
jgi:hypothetical protein